MKAIRVEQFGGPDVLRMEEIPTPTPGEGEVLVRVRAAGVNPVETYIRSGQYVRLPALPYTPGSDAGGIVEAVGPGVESFRPGDRVYTHASTSGAYAELALCHESHVHPLPENVSFEQGAAVGVPCGAAWRGLVHRGQMKAGESVLVHGASGAVGIAAVQLASAAGLTVTATAGNESGRQLVRAHGAHHALDHDSAVDRATIDALTEGRGFDLILEMAAHVNLGRDLGVLAKGGRVVVVGSRGPIEIDPRATMSNESDIRGMTVMNATPDEMRSMHAALGAALATGVLRPIIGLSLPLDRAPEAHQAQMQSGPAGKIVLIP